MGGVRQGPPHEAQHRDRPAAGPAGGQRPPAWPSCSTPCCSASRARRSCTTATRSAWATTSTWATGTGSGPHAVVAGPQRRLQPGRLRPAVPAPADGPGVRVPGGQRGGRIRNSSSLLHWMKRMLEVRKQHPVFGIGTFEVVSVENPSVLAYMREPAGDRHPGRRGPVPAGPDDGRSGAVRHGAVRLQPVEVGPAGRACPCSGGRARCRSSCSVGCRSPVSVSCRTS